MIATVVLVALVVFFSVEMLILSRFVGAYYALCVPVRVSGSSLSLPDSGRSELCTFQRSGDRWYWAGVKGRTTMGLHGVVFCDDGQVRMRFAPPLTIVGALVWLGGLGVYRGEAALTLSIAVVLFIGTIIVYARQAVLVGESLVEQQRMKEHA